MNKTFEKEKDNSMSQGSDFDNQLTYKTMTKFVIQDSKRSIDLGSQGTMKKKRVLEDEGTSRSPRPERESLKKDEGIILSKTNRQ